MRRGQGHEQAHLPKRRVKQFAEASPAPTNAVAKRAAPQYSSRYELPPRHSIPSQFEETGAEYQVSLVAALTADANASKCSRPVPDRRARRNELPYWLLDVYPRRSYPQRQPQLIPAVLFSGSPEESYAGAPSAQKKPRRSRRRFGGPTAASVTLAWVCLRISLRVSNFCRLWSNRNAQTRPALAHMDKLFLAVVAIGRIVLIAAPRLNGPPFPG